MTVLYLGPQSPLSSYIAMSESLIRTEGRIENCNADFIVSYGYRHILPKSITDEFDGRAVNLHISLLPWNRGAHPNYFSIVEGTPKGVSLHYMDSGIDTGDLICQRQVEVTGTLATSYLQLKTEAEAMFMQQWLSVKAGRCKRIKQGKGTYHKASELDVRDLPKGWNTPIEWLTPNRMAA